MSIQQEKRVNAQREVSLIYQERQTLAASLSWIDARDYDALINEIDALLSTKLFASNSEYLSKLKVRIGESLKKVLVNEQQIKDVQEEEKEALLKEQNAVKQFKESQAKLVTAEKEQRRLERLAASANEALAKAITAKISNRLR